MVSMMMPRVLNLSIVILRPFGPSYANIAEGKGKDTVAILIG